MLRIKKLHILILKQFGLLFLGTFFISLFVLMMQFVWQYIDVLIGKGLTVDVLGQFFWYMALMLVPQALPLAILLSSLIAFGNLGESSELTAIKASGISLHQTLRPLAFVVLLIAIASFYFQNNIGPASNHKIAQLLVSMKQKSPELEIPEGIFYDGIPGCNLYVQKKDLDTGMLYGIMIYRMTDSFEDAAIILADSGMLQSTAEKKHLLLNLYSGEWFENMRSQELAGSASVPYRRETFWHKSILLDFDGDFSLTDGAGLSQRAQAKSLTQIAHDMDSLNVLYDSIGRSYYDEAQRMSSFMALSTSDSVRLKAVKSGEVVFDSLFARLTPDKKRSAVNNALMRVQQNVTDLSFKAMVTEDGDGTIRRHQIEAFNKFTLALSCIIFFFIGAPLGAIIRKGGMGVPIIVSVFVFIVFYILDNTGYRMARQGLWTVWFGKSLATAVLAPTAAFITYKANNDSAVFNLDLYMDILRHKILGLRASRNIVGKEVIIHDPAYADDALQLQRLSNEVTAYMHEHRLASAPNIIKVFFKYEPDHEIERISDELEAVVDDLGNTRDKVVMTEINKYPILATKAHTRPFERKWLNILSFFIVPLGLFFYFRLWQFRRRLNNDIKTILKTNKKMIKRCNELAAQAETNNSETTQV